MKTKVLLSACALSACFIACTNDEYMTEQTNAGTVTESGEIVGADLVSKGMNITLGGDGISTRVNTEGWEINDQIGMAWYNVNEAAGIAGTQSMTDWLNNRPTSGTPNVDNIYANHIFTTCGDANTFKTTTNVYQGAYFVYFPYQPLDEVKPLVLEPNKAAQEKDFDADMLNNATYISAQDFIEKGTGVDADNNLTKKFYMTNIVNAVGIDATPEAVIKGNDFMKSLRISGLTINLNGKELFLPKAQVITRAVPDRVLVDGSTTEVDEDATLEDLYEATDKISDPDNLDAAETFLYAIGADYQYSDELTTTVENENYTLANDANRVRVFAFPTKTGAHTWTAANKPYVTVAVTSPNGNYLGFFNVNVTNSAKLIEKLEGMLGNANDDATLQKIHRSGNDMQRIVKDQVANLLAKNFVPETYVTKVSQWNDLMKLYDALAACGVEYDDTNRPVVRVGAELDFTTGENALIAPENVKIRVKSENSGKIVIAADTTWPENLTTNHTQVLNVEVDPNVELTVSDNIVLDADITNNGIINAGFKASIGTYNGGELTNNGRVNVVYGSYVYTDGANDGTIAYTLTGDDDTTKIFNLIDGKENTNDRLASVNTLVIPTGIALDLNAKGADSTTDDPYTGTTTGGQEMPDLSNVDIELNGGTIEKVLVGTYTSVAKVTVIGGNSTMKDVKTPTIVVEEGTLNIESAPEKVENKITLEDVKTITNHGTIKANTDVEVVDIYNEGLIKVGKDYTVTYSGEFKQQNGGTYENDVRPVTPVVVDTTEVMNTWSTYKAALEANAIANNYDGTYASVAKHINENADNQQYNAYKFYAALNAWRVEIGLTSKEYTEITAFDLREFEIRSGQSLSLKETAN